MINLPQTNTITNVYRAHLPTNGARTHNPSDDLNIVTYTNFTNYGMFILLYIDSNYLHELIVHFTF